MSSNKRSLQKILVAGVILFCFFIIPTSAQGQGRDINWFLDTSLKVPIAIALNSPVDAGTREIFLLMRSEDFTKDTLKHIFSSLALRYSENLRITAYSNLRHLEEQISASYRNSCLMFSDTPEGQQAMEEFYKSVYPPTTGYHRALYFRYPHREEFFYSPKPDEEAMAVVKLKP